MAANLKLFMRGNQKAKEPTTYAATKSLCDEKGEPLLWTLRPVTSAENELLRESCTKDIQVAGKPNLFRQKLNTSAYMKKMVCKCVEYPNLYDAELQDSYGVKEPEDLLMAMVNDPGEYSDFAAFVQKFNGFDASLQDEVDEAKNS